jgi:hypothetical protein
MKGRAVIADIALDYCPHPEHESAKGTMLFLMI